MKRKIVAGLIAGTVLMSGCASMTPTYEKSEFYSIYDIKANGASTAQIKEGIKVALQGNMKGVSVQNSIPPSPLPEKPARFQQTQPFKNSGLGALMAAQGQSLSVQTCIGSIMTTTAHDDMQGENTTFFTCLMPYQAGYSLNVYYTFSKSSGGIGNMGKDMARALMGDSSQFLPRTLKSIEDGVRSAGAQITLLKSYP